MGFAHVRGLEINIKLAREKFLLDVDITIDCAKVTTIVGPSGSGKSSLLSAIAGFIKPNEGYMNYQGETWYNQAKNCFVATQQRQLGMVFQDYALFDHLNVEKNIGFGIKRNNADQQVNTWLEKLHLSEQRSLYPRQLSGGQRQRVALGRTLITRPRLLLLDEPLSAVDASLREVLSRELKMLMQTSKVPVIHVTHDLTEAQYLADEILVMDKGKIIASGSTHEVFRQPQDLRSAKIVGWKNILKVAQRRLNQVNGAWGSAVLAQDASSAVAYIAIRPEHINIAPEQMVPEKARVSGIEVTVREVMDKGAIKELYCICSDGSSLVLHRPWQESLPELGTVIKLYFPPQYIQLLAESAG